MAESSARENMLFVTGVSTILMIAYGIFCVFYFGYVQQDTPTSKSNYYVANSYGTSFYKPFESYRLLFTASALNLILIVAACFIGRTQNYSKIALVIGAAAALINFIIFIVTAVQDWSNCNTVGTPPNACRDRRFCCIPSIYSNNIHGCPVANVIPSSGNICTSETANLKLENLGMDTGYGWFLVFLAVSCVCGVLIAILAYMATQGLQFVNDFIGGLITTQAKRRERADQTHIETSTKSVDSTKRSKKQ